MAKAGLTGVQVNTQEMVIGAALVMAAYLFAKREAGQAVKGVAQAVNPVNQDNVINRGFEALYQGITGSDQAPGEDLYDWLNPAENVLTSGSDTWAKFYEPKGSR